MLRRLSVSCMSAHLRRRVFQLLGTLRFVRRWVVLGRVLWRAWRELWALAVLLLLLLLLCIHLGTVVRGQRSADDPFAEEECI